MLSFPSVEARESCLSDRVNDGDNNFLQAKAVSHPPSNLVEIRLPEQIDDLFETFFVPHRRLESQYRALPWPSQMQNIVVFTEVEVGRGDIAAAAKVIALMQKFCPTLTFDWILKGALLSQYDPASFLNCNNPTKVHIRYWGAEPLQTTPADFLIAGPCKFTFNREYIEESINLSFGLIS